jgi:hypothetical protein
MNSQLTLNSNLMIDDEKHKPQCRFMLGDYVALLYKGLADKRSWDQLTPQQIKELQLYVVCAHCGQTCAGTCS